MRSELRARRRYFIALLRERFYQALWSSILSLIGLGLLVRDEFMRPVDESKYKLGALMSRVPFLIWVIVSFSTVIYWIFESAFRVHSKSGQSDELKLDFWEECREFKLFQVACLWENVAPPMNAESITSPKVLARLHKLKVAIERKDLIFGRLEHSDEKSEGLNFWNAYTRFSLKITNDTTIHLDDLKRYIYSLESIERPLFLSSKNNRSLFFRPATDPLVSRHQAQELPDKQEGT